MKFSLPSMAEKALYDLAPTKLTISFPNLVTCMANCPRDSPLERVTCIGVFKVGYEHAFDWNVGFGLRFNHQKSQDGTSWQTAQ